MECLQTVLLTSGLWQLAGGRTMQWKPEEEEWEDEFEDE